MNHFLRSSVCSFAYISLQLGSFSCSFWFSLQPFTTFWFLQTGVYFCWKSLWTLISLHWYRFHPVRCLIVRFGLFVHTINLLVCAWFSQFCCKCPFKSFFLPGTLYFPYFRHVLPPFVLLLFFFSGCWFCQFSSLFSHPWPIILFFSVFTTGKICTDLIQTLRRSFPGSKKACRSMAGFFADWSLLFSI